MSKIYILLLNYVFLNNALLQSQTLTPLNAPFLQGSPMQFAYTGGTGATTDWIGIYKHGQTPGSISSTLWQYVLSSAGTIEFAGTLDTGFYDAHLFCCDGYTKLASFNNFHISAPRLRSRLSIYRTTDILRFYVTNVASNDHLAVFKASDFVGGAVLPGAVPVFEKIFSNAVASVTIEVSPLTEPGDYVAVLRNAGNEALATKPISVKTTPAWPATVTRLGLGSCGSQNSAQPTLEHILTHDIDAFIYMGDNVYIDTYDLGTLQNEYEHFLTTRTEFQNLRASVPLLATWDDHDYGCCDEDADYPLKVESQQVFLDFWEEPANSPRRLHPGIYTQYLLGPDGQKLQIILLDTRYFLDDKRPNNGCGINDYCAWAGPGDVNKTMMGAEQWLWLKNALLEPADLRLVVSSVQFSSSYHGFESWSLFPYERGRMQELILETQAEHVFFASGDMHYSEVSKLDNNPAMYPIYDFTASGINTAWPPEVNQHRVDNKAYGDPNVGLLEIDWAAKMMHYSVWDAQNAERFSHSVAFEEMEFPADALPEINLNAPILRQVPAPGQQSARLEWQGEMDAEVLLFDALGRFQRRANLQANDFVEVLGLAPGLYWAQVQNGKTMLAHAKVWVQ